jgi:hypothetical protein
MTSPISQLDHKISRIKNIGEQHLKQSVHALEYAHERARESIRRDAQAKHEVYLAMLDETIDGVVKLIDLMKPQIPNSYRVLFMKVAHLMPESVKHRVAETDIFWAAVSRALGDVYREQWKDDYARDVKYRKKRQDEDEAYYSACVCELQGMIHCNDRRRQNYFWLLGYLRSGFVVPRHRGLSGFEIIVHSIHDTMPEQAAEWHDKLEIGLENARKREDDYQTHRKIIHTDV